MADQQKPPLDAAQQARLKELFPDQPLQLSWHDPMQPQWPFPWPPPAGVQFGVDWANNPHDTPLADAAPFDNGRDREVLDLLAYQWDSYRSKARIQWQEKAVAKVLRERCHADDGTARVLEFGCRTGHFLNLGFEPHTYTGADISDRVLSAADAVQCYRKTLTQWSFVRGDFATYHQRPTNLRNQYTHVLALFGEASRILSGDLSAALDIYGPGVHFALMVYVDRRADVLPVYEAWPRYNGIRPNTVYRRHYTPAALEKALRFQRNVQISGIDAGLPYDDEPTTVQLIWNRLCEAVKPQDCQWLLATGTTRGGGA